MEEALDWRVGSADENACLLRPEPHVEVKERQGLAAVYLAGLKLLNVQSSEPRDCRQAHV